MHLLMLATLRKMEARNRKKKRKAMEMTKKMKSTKKKRKMKKMRISWRKTTVNSTISSTNLVFL